MKKLLIIISIMTPIGIIYLMHKHQQKIETRQRAAAESCCCPYFIERDMKGVCHAVYYSS